MRRRAPCLLIPPRSSRRFEKFTTRSHSVLRARLRCWLWQLPEEFLPARPSFVARFLVRFANGGISWLAGAHKTVAGAFVDDRLICFPSGFHQFLRLWDGRIHALVVLGIKTIHRARDVFHFIGRIRRLTIK